MCDVDKYSTGLLLVQISAGLLASVFFAKVKVSSKNEESLPVAETVSVQEATAYVPNIESGITAPQVQTQLHDSAFHSLRRRNPTETREVMSSGVRTITMSAREVENIQFNL